MALEPEIGKTAETETGYAKEILHAPYEGELEGCQALAGISAQIIALIVNVLAQELEIKRVLEVTAVQEVINTTKESVVDGVAIVHTTVVLYLEAEVTKDGNVLPEIEATGNFQIGTAGSIYLILIVLAAEVVVHEEEGVTPIVGVETFQGSSNVLTIRSEIVKHLEIGLSLGNLAKGERCYSNCKNSFFRHK